MRFGLMLAAIALIGLVGCGNSGGDSGVPKDPLPKENAGEAVSPPKKGPADQEKVKPLK